MYKLQEHEGLYMVADNHYVVANQVEILDDKVICRHEFTWRNRKCVTDREYKLGEVGIFWDEDTKDRCSRPLEYSSDIYLFHESLYEYGFLVDDINDWADASDFDD